MKRFICILSTTVLILHFGAAALLANEIVYTVKSGDTLWDIASKNGCSVERLRALNNLQSDFLNIGEQLYLQEIPNQPALNQPSEKASIYYVQAGDSLWEIAAKHGISVDTLKKINNLQSDFLQIGDRLNVQAIKQTSENAQVSRNAEPTLIYTVESGDSLWGIANKFGMTVDRLKEINNLSNDLVNEGIGLVVESQNVPAPSRSGSEIGPGAVLEKAAEYLGTPYQYGGQGPKGFDCSGFVKYVYAHFGLDLPRTAASQFQSGSGVNKANLLPGDLVFFKCHSSTIDHVGIYCGNDKFIHSSSPRSGGVIYSTLSESYYAKSYAGARRILP